jgi:hypothetical protein
MDIAKSIFKIFGSRQTRKPQPLIVRQQVPVRSPLENFSRDEVQKQLEQLNQKFAEAQVAETLAHGKFDQLHAAVEITKAKRDAARVADHVDLQLEAETSVLEAREAGALESWNQKKGSLELVRVERSRISQIISRFENLDVRKAIFDQIQSRFAEWREKFSEYKRLEMELAAAEDSCWKMARESSDEEIRHLALRVANDMNLIKQGGLPWAERPENQTNWTAERVLHNERVRRMTN